MLFRVEGIVIRSMDYGEGNKIITLLTEHDGKVGVLVRGAKKPKSRHAALTLPFTYGLYIFFRNRGLGTLNAGEIMESHHLLREDLTLTAYSSYACELLDRVLQDEETGAFWYSQLKACLEALESGKDPAVIIHLYEMKILQAAGYGPELDVCVVSGTDQELEFFSPRLGGVLSRRSKHLDPAAMPLSPPVLKLLRVFSRLDMRRLGSIAVKDETKAELKVLMRALMDMQIGVQLKSRNFLDQLDKYQI